VSDEQERGGALSGQISPQLILVLGGARSGKSDFAQRLAERSGRSVAFIATASAGDEEMRERIVRHRAARPREWQTIEEPLDLAQALRRAASLADVLLLDCMTLWLSNWLMARGETDMEAMAASAAHYSEEALREVEALLSAFSELDAKKALVVVSNEVGLGLVPPYALGRLYRDILGRVNQRLALVASRVYLMVAGLAVDIKRLHEEATL
jgi:adenosylcobinamide kinase/adenosylcobinamide-phosphate guanylyltransferase